jgi:apolipoprotein D and lipocalin family protein
MRVISYFLHSLKLRLMTLVSKQKNGTVDVSNTCQRSGAISNIQGTASAVDPEYGDKGVFRVQFPGVPKADSCPGPNYIVQGKRYLRC